MKTLIAGFRCIASPAQGRSRPAARASRTAVLALPGAVGRARSRRVRWRSGRVAPPGRIGILTPPFGVALFVVAKVGNIPFHVLARAIVPFLGPLLVVQVIVTYWPRLVLFLPRLFLD
jgi:hypothetical protein